MSRLPADPQGQTVWSAPGVAAGDRHTQGLAGLLVGGCFGLYVGGRVSQSPPVSPEVDYIV